MLREGHCYFTGFVGVFRIILDSVPTVADKCKYKYLSAISLGDWGRTNPRSGVCVKNMITSVG
jgi:hypothetical protein